MTSPSPISAGMSRRVALGATGAGVLAALTACASDIRPTAEGSASSSASESASAAASASASSDKSYKGFVKFDNFEKNGEYVPATAEKKAQNVPKPAEPEDGYREKSVEGMRKTLDAWVKWGNYGVQTGDYSMARQFVSPTFKSELEAYEGVERLYQHGGWVIDGIESLTADGAPWSEDGETYFWKAYHVWEKEIYVAADGSWRSWTNEDKTNDTYKIELKHNGQKWELIGYVKVED